MNKLLKKAVNLIFIITFLFATTSVQAESIQVMITGIKSGKGQINLNVYRNAEGFKTRKPFKKWSFPKRNIVAGKMTVICSLEPGTYGISLVDDRNSNGKLDRNASQVPTEGFGFSNYYMENLKTPLFENFKFDVRNPHKQVTVKLKYLLEPH